MLHHQASARWTLPIQDLLAGRPRFVQREVSLKKAAILFFSTFACLLLLLKFSTTQVLKLEMSVFS